MNKTQIPTLTNHQHYAEQNNTYQETLKSG